MKTPDGKTELVKGVGATLFVGGDAYPYTVIDFTSTGKTLTLLRDNFTPTDKHDFYTNQDYTFSPGFAATRDDLEKARWSKRSGCYRINPGTRLFVGYRKAFIDPSF
jgi:hypothetical protein